MSRKKIATKVKPVALDFDAVLYDFEDFIGENELSMSLRQRQILRDTFAVLLHARDMIEDVRNTTSIPAYRIPTP